MTRDPILNAAIAREIALHRLDDAKRRCNTRAIHYWRREVARLTREALK